MQYMMGQSDAGLCGSLLLNGCRTMDAASPTPPVSVSRAIVDLMKAGRDRQSATPIAPPRDCVVALPSMTAETVELVGFDAAGNARLRVEIPATEDVEQWQTWMLRWVRRRFPSLSLMG